jgi:hypothetical protein
VNITYSTDVLKVSIGLIGDLGQIYQIKVISLIKQRFVDELIQVGLQDGDIIIQDTAQWAKQVRLPCNLSLD